MVDARLARDGAGVARGDEADEEPAGVAACAVAVFPTQPVLVLRVTLHPTSTNENKMDSEKVSWDTSKNSELNTCIQFQYPNAVHVPQITNPNT